MNKQRIVIVTVLVVAIKLAMHLLADSNSGFQGDELLHIETGNHLSFGYMEFPPVIGFLAYIQNLFESHTVFVNHITVHLASIIILLLLIKITTDEGGGWFSILLIGLSIIVAPGFGRSQQLFQPVVFIQLFWVLSFYFFYLYVRSHQSKYLWALALASAIAFLTKYTAVFLLVGLGSMFFFSKTRRSLIQLKFWWPLFVFFVTVSPNLYWQIDNDFPVLQMMSRLYETQLDDISKIETLLDLFISITPLNAALIFLSIIYLIRNRVYHRILMVSMMISILTMLYMNGKFYYMYPVILTFIPFGTVLVEGLSKRKWIKGFIVAIYLLVGVLFIPHGMAVTRLDNYLKEFYPYEGNKEIEGGEFAVSFSERYSDLVWNEVLGELHDTVDSLNSEGISIPMIWGKHYSQAGIIQLMKDEHQLPDAFSYHGSFYTWSPYSGNMPKSILALSYGDVDFFEPFFAEVVKLNSIYDPYADEPQNLYQHIYLCRNPKYSFKEIKSLFKDRIFE